MISALAGVVVGILSGLLGIGGGMIMVPLFRLGFGLPAIQATATSLLAIIPTSAAGCTTHIRNRTCVVAVGLAAGLTGMVTSPIGVNLANVSPSWAIMLTAALIIAYSATTMLRKAIQLKPSPTIVKAQNMPAAGAAHAHVPGPQPGQTPNGAEEEHPGGADGRRGADGAGACGAAGPQPTLCAANSNQVKGCTSEAHDAGSEGNSGTAERGVGGGPAAPQAPAPSAPRRPSASRRQIAIGAAAGAVAGLGSGYVGVGGAFIMVPMFLGLANIPMKQASGTSLIAVTLIAIPGTITQILLGNAQVAVGLALAVGSIPGAVFGANLIKRVPERTLRGLFGCMLLVVAVFLALNEFLAG